MHLSHQVQPVALQDPPQRSVFLLQLLHRLRDAVRKLLDGLVRASACGAGREMRRHAVLLPHERAAQRGVWAREVAALLAVGGEVPAAELPRGEAVRARYHGVGAREEVLGEVLVLEGLALVGLGERGGVGAVDEELVDLHAEGEVGEDGVGVGLLLVDGALGEAQCVGAVVAGEHAAAAEGVPAAACDDGVVAEAVADGADVELRDGVDEGEAVGHGGLRGGGEEGDRGEMVGRRGAVRGREDGDGGGRGVVVVGNEVLVVISISMSIMINMSVLKIRRGRGRRRRKERRRLGCGV